MTKQKQSFFQRLAGVQSNEEETSRPVLSVYENEETEVSVPSHDVRAFERAPREDVWSQNTPVSDEEGQLTIDVYQTDNDVIIKSTIAGVKPEDLDVSINNDMVTIKGERKNEDVVETGNYYYQECYWGSFARSILLPVDIVAEKVEASLKNGILTVKLPKADNTKVKKIQVRGF